MALAWNAFRRFGCDRGLHIRVSRLFEVILFRSLNVWFLLWQRLQIQFPEPDRSFQLRLFRVPRTRLDGKIYVVLGIGTNSANLPNSIAR